MPTFRAVVRSDFPVGSGGGTNTWHLRVLSDSPQGETAGIEALMETVRQFYLDTRPAVPSSIGYQWDGILTEVGAVEPTYRPGVTGWTIPGVATTRGFTSASTMACVTWRSSLAGRSGRGRTFVGPLAADVVQDNGTLENDITILLRGAAADLIAAQDSVGDGALGVWSETDGVIRDFVAATVNDRTAVLRSRRG